MQLTAFFYRAITGIVGPGMGVAAASAAGVRSASAAWYGRTATAAAARRGATGTRGGGTLDRRAREPAMAATAAEHAEIATPVKMADQQLQQSRIQHQQQQ